MWKWFSTAPSWHYRGSCVTSPFKLSETDALTSRCKLIKLLCVTLWWVDLVCLFETSGAFWTIFNWKKSVVSHIIFPRPHAWLWVVMAYVRLVLLSWLCAFHAPLSFMNYTHKKTPFLIIRSLECVITLSPFQSDSHQNPSTSKKLLLCTKPECEVLHCHATAIVS